MKVCVIGSGSKGNSTLIEVEGTKIMIDCGISARNVEKRLSNHNLSLDNLDAVLLTHEHSDHTKFIQSIQKKVSAPIYASAGTLKHTKPELIENCGLNVISPNFTFPIGSINIKPIDISHDGNEPLGFLLTCNINNKKLLYLTDLGYVSEKIIEIGMGADIVIIESNHDPKMVMSNKKYPYHIKNRIIGDKGHLCNVDCAVALSKIVTDNTKEVIFAHISQENNSFSLPVDECISTFLKLEKSVNFNYNVAIQDEELFIEIS